MQRVQREVVQGEAEAAARAAEEEVALQAAEEAAARAAEEATRAAAEEAAEEEVVQGEEVAYFDSFLQQIPRGLHVVEVGVQVGKQHCHL